MAEIQECSWPVLNSRPGTQLSSEQIASHPFSNIGKHESVSIHRWLSRCEQLGSLVVVVVVVVVVYSHKS